MNMHASHSGFQKILQVTWNQK